MIVEHCEDGKFIQTVETAEKLHLEMERAEQSVAVDVPSKVWGCLEDKWGRRSRDLQWEDVRSGSYRRLSVSIFPRPSYLRHSGRSNS